MNEKIESKKTLSAILAIVAGPFGVHKFVLGYKTEGTILLCSTLACFILGFCLFFPFFFIPMIGVATFIEGIIYLTKSDEDFVETYQNNKKAWF